MDANRVLVLARALFGIAICATWPIETSIAQESGAQEPSKMCRSLDGTYKNSGTQVSGKDRGSKLPPLISRDVLRRWKHGVHTEWVAVRMLQGDRIRFSLLDSNGIEVIAYEHPIACTNGEVVFERSATGGSEGYSGTTVTQVKLRVTVDSGALLANVFERSEGRDFLLIPRADVAERQFLFESKGVDHN